MPTCSFCGQNFDGKACPTSSCRSKAWRAANPTPRQERRCRGCNQLFVPYHNAQIYCSALCRPNISQRITPENRICYKCNEPFTPYHHSQLICVECKHQTELRKIWREQAKQLEEAPISSPCRLCGKTAFHAPSLQPGTYLCVSCRNPETQQTRPIGGSPNFNIDEEFNDITKE